MHTNQRELQNKQLITKQQLFVNPLSLLLKQIVPTSNSPQPVQTLQSNEFTNIGEMILDSVQSNVTPHTKTKLITKIEPTNKIKNYRTSICPYGIQCRKRLTCTYAHNQTQLRKPYKNRKNPCIRYQKGLCGSGAACPDYHGNMDLKKKNYRYKVLPCNEWNEKGHCSKGNLCIYLHGQEDNVNIGEMIDEENVDKSLRPQPDKEKGTQSLFIQKQEQFIHQEGHCTNENTQKCTNENSERDKKLMIGQIFKQSTKKTIQAKETIQQKVVQNNHQNEGIGQEENFNIEFNF